MSNMKMYIGDSVYVEANDYDNGCTLWTDNGTGRKTNVIVLEPETLNALLSWVTSILREER
jgi:hypothetical protein